MSLWPSLSMRYLPVNHGHYEIKLEEQFAWIVALLCTRYVDTTLTCIFAQILFQSSTTFTNYVQYFFQRTFLLNTSAHPRSLIAASFNNALIWSVGGGALLTFFAALQTHDNEREEISSFYWCFSIHPWLAMVTSWFVSIGTRESWPILKIVKNVTFRNLFYLLCCWEYGCI